MDRHKVSLLIHTLKYLRSKQVIYRMFYFVRNRFFKKNYSKLLISEIKPIIWKDGILNSNSFFGNKTFSFINLEYQFESEINCNFNDYGKLWCFNINYFDFLNQKSIVKEEGTDLIKN